MAYRAYLRSSAAAVPLVSPAFDASWEVTSGAIRRILDSAKDQRAYATSAVTTSLNSPAGAVDVLLVQYVSAPLNGNQTISGAIKGQVRAQESNVAGDLRMQCVIRVVSNDGSTVRGTLISSNGSALSSEFASSLQNRTIPLGGSTVPTSVNALDDDRVVVELGYRKHENATTSRSGTFDLGAVAGGTDLPEDETTTTQGVPWIEFADTLSFKSSEFARVSQAVAEAMIAPTSQKARVSQAVAEALIAPTSQKARASQTVLEVLYPSVDSAAEDRVSQAVVEVLMVPDGRKARLSQAVLEVLYPSSNPIGKVHGKSWGTIIG